MKYGFIGCGNMGGAIARALRKSNDGIMICDPSPNAKLLAEELCCAYGANEDAVRDCDAIILAVKPQILRTVLAPLVPLIQQKKPLLITIAAGIKIADISAMVGREIPIIRIMPNTPVMVGKGMITYCYNDLVSDRALSTFLSDMTYAGKLDPIPEKLIDAASAIAGCGPAFMYMFMEALADGAVACGFPREKALEYAAMTMVGSAEMVIQSGKHPGELKDAVCSPGGSTIQGVRALEEAGLRGVAMNAIIAAYEKTVDLGK